MAKPLEAKFHDEMLNVFKRAKDECGYVATRFLQLVNEVGGLAAAKALLAKDRFAYGLTELWERHRLDISMEAVVLDPRWASLFTEAELAVARGRLEALGFDLP